MELERPDAKEQADEQGTRGPEEKKRKWGAARVEMASLKEYYVINVLQKRAGITGPKQAPSRPSWMIKSRNSRSRKLDGPGPPSKFPRFGPMVPSASGAFCQDTTCLP